MSKALALTSYRRLLTDITSLYENARRALIAAYWEIGRRIVEVEQQGAVKAAYGTGLLSKLSEDLTKKNGSGFSVENLRRMRRFYLDYSKQSAPTELRWAQYIEVLPLENKKEREDLLQRAVREELTHKELRALVRRELVREQVAENLGAKPEERKPVELLKVPKTGRFHTYQILAAEDVSWPQKDVLLLDRGFRSYCPLSPEESRGLRAGDIVEWTGPKPRKIPSGPQGTSPKSLLYTYRAYLRKVIDGDTLWIVLDAGVRNVMRQKLRLRGIDCPEVDTEEGKIAKKFVENLLRDVPALTILSSQNATYDRFEADVWFEDKNGTEVYLNNRILEAGLAVMLGKAKHLGGDPSPSTGLRMTRY